MANQISKSILVFVAMLFALINIYAFNIEVVNTNPSPIVAGDYADITLRITNPTQDTRENVMIKIDNTDEFKALSSDTLSLKKVYGLESTTKTFRVFFSEDIPEGFINLPIKIDYDGINSKTNVQIYVQGALRNPELYVGDVSATPNEILPDSKDNNIVVTLQNLGDKDAELVSASLVLDDSKAKGSNSFSLIDSVSSIVAGGEATFEFKIDVNEDVSEMINSTLVLRYRVKDSVGESYKTIEEKKDFNIKISDAPYLKVINVEQLNDFAIGSNENIIRLTLRNDGSEDAKEVRVRVVPDSSYPFLFEQLTEYVSSKIEIGEQVTIDFKVEVLSTADIKNYSTTLLLESLIGDTRYTQEDSMNINVVGKEPKTNTEKGLIVIAIILSISAIFGFYRIKNRVKK